MSESSMSTFEQRIAGLSPEKRALLLKQLGSQKAPARPRIGRQPRDPERIPLSLAQRRLWLIDQITPESATYNVSQVVRLRGPLDAAALEAALDDLLAHHEVLRTTFARTAEGPVQRIAEQLAIGLHLEDLAGGEDLAGRADAAAELERRLREEAEKPFDLARGPLWGGPRGCRARTSPSAALPPPHRGRRLALGVLCTSWRRCMRRARGRAVAAPRAPGAVRGLRDVAA